jgi:dTDP-4-dehydrorhamnose reductase
LGSDPVVLVTGAGGQVGEALRRRLPQGRFPSHVELDVTDSAGVRSATKGADAVIHLAALTHVDDCERRPEVAFAVNAEGTRIVAEAAEVEGARVIFLSTDYVFDGTQDSEYVEEDAPAPINVYGRSKLRGERHVAERRGNLIVRTSWVFGNGRNFVRAILAAAGRGDGVVVVDDQMGRPTSAEALASALAHLVEEPMGGIIHVAGDGTPCTWADLAESALAAAGLPVEVERIDSQTYARTADKVVAPRPRNSSLSLAKARRYRVPLQGWGEALRDYVEALG